MLDIHVMFRVERGHVAKLYCIFLKVKLPCESANGVCLAIES